MRFYLGVTDNSWFGYLSKQEREDVNFWQPGGRVSFKALQPGAPFLFKLKSPMNAIGGLGFFSCHSFLPMSVAWDTFRNRNGCDTYDAFRHMILQYRSDKLNINPTLGCIVLTDPIFFQREDWIPVPADWSGSIVQGKGYSTSDEIGSAIWKQVEALLPKYQRAPVQAVDRLPFLVEDAASPAYGKSVLTKVRLGQGAFRVMVTDAYSRRCAITGEKTLPVLEAAHIKPYADSGPHLISNGLLLRSDMHKLFDGGYLTVTPDLKVEISGRIKEEFENGKEYYQYQGKDLLYLPAKGVERPDRRFIDWHNEQIYRG